MAEIIITYISLSIAIVSILFVAWDHFKDDRLLTKRVKNFYDIIEDLIFYFYQMKIAQLLWIKNPENKTYENDFFEYDKRHLFNMGRLQQNFGEYSKYLGLTFFSLREYLDMREI